MTPELRHMLRDDDLNHEEQKQVLELAIKFHHDRFYKQPFAGPQAVAVLFDKPSTRTRSSFSIGVAELGGYPLVIDKSGSQLGRGEPVADTARVLNRMAYGVVWRTFGQGRVEMAKYSTHPVVNALTDDFHPCQILADFQTIAEHRGGVDNLKNQTIAYLGDAANNMANSYLLGGAVAGMDVRVAGPYGYLPRPDIVADAKRIAAETGGSILVTTDAKEAVKDADCVFTDTWVSMGEEAEYAIRSKPFWDYQVNTELMALAKPDALFQHCLPAYRGKEVTAEVIDGPQSVVWDEAENRLHAQKADLVDRQGPWRRKPARMSETGPSLQRPASRAARLSAIEQALATHIITSQSQLSKILIDEGIAVTQATLSRDLDEMHAVKTRLKDGTVAYTVGRSVVASEGEDVGERGEAQMSRVLNGLVTSVAAARNLVVVHTPSGAAQYVASVIDKQSIEGVLGTIAGDDTVMVICTNDDTAVFRSDWLLSLASK